ncbi:hypothetical protein ACHAPY_011177 [Fusarium culmorum]
MLRPFFRPTQKGSLNGWKFSLDDSDGNVFLHGANPGTAQEHNPDHHPHLLLSETMIPYPIVEPGDTVFWSADTIHGTESENTGNVDACVFYIPSVPLTPSNAQYVAQQRDAFLKGIPPPDFPGGSGESEFVDPFSPTIGLLPDLLVPPLRWRSCQGIKWSHWCLADRSGISTQ